MLRVAVIHDRPIIRLGIAALLDLDPGVVLAGAGDSGSIPMAWGQLDVLVAPIAALTGGGVRGSGPPILVVSGGPHRDGDCVDVRAGTYGCVAVDVTGEELSAAVRAVAAHQRFLPESSGHLADGPAVSPARLSPRELQAVTLIAQGFTHHQVARRMGIAQSTLDTYVKRVRSKLGLGNKAELAVAALSLTRLAGRAPGQARSCPVYW
jgi:DNA-binding NarL/FixJ family response regulator